MLELKAFWPPFPNVESLFLNVVRERVNEIWYLSLQYMNTNAMTRVTDIFLSKFWLYQPIAKTGSQFVAQCLMCPDLNKTFLCLGTKFFAWIVPAKIIVRKAHILLKVKPNLNI